MDQLLRDLEHTDPAIRRHAAWALGEREATQAVEPLLRRLSDTSRQVRLVSTWALGEIKDASAIEELIAALTDDDELVREMALLALGEIEHPRAVGALLRAAERDETTRRVVVWALAEIEGEEARSARSQVFRRWDRAPWPHQPVWAGEFASGASRATVADVPARIEALRHRNATVRRAAAAHLGFVGDPRAVDPLLDALRDPVPEVRAMVVWALDEINPSDTDQ